MFYVILIYIIIDTLIFFNPKNKMYIGYNSRYDNCPYLKQYDHVSGVCTALSIIPSTNTAFL